MVCRNPPRTIIESPLGTRPDGTRASPEELKRNQEYAIRCVRHSLSIGEAPFASHVLYPLVLDDAIPEERGQGIQAGFAWGARADQVAVYLDYEITPGMIEGIERARLAGQRIRYRKIGQNDAPCSFATSEGSVVACDAPPPDFDKWAPEHLREIAPVSTWGEPFFDEFDADSDESWEAAEARANGGPRAEDESPFELAAHDLGEPVG